MIRITRAPVPPALQRSRAANRYSKAEVRLQLWEMQHEKCCYCERKVDLHYSSHIEHYRPKDPFPTLKNRWDNLLLACASCNLAKWDKFPYLPGGAPAVIDPTNTGIDPEDHIDFLVANHLPEQLVGRCVPKAGSLLGQATIECIKLDSNDHQRRTFRFLIYQLLPAVEQVLRGHGDAAQVDLDRRRLQGMQDDEREFAGLARVVIREYFPHGLP